MKRWSNVALVCAILIAVTPPCRVNADELERQGLEGASGVHVIVEEPAGDLGNYVDRDALKVQVELTLRSVGVPVLTAEESRAQSDAGVLDLIVGGLELDPGGGSHDAFVMTFLLTMSRELWQVRGGKPIRRVIARGWMKSTMVYRTLASVRSAGPKQPVDELVSEFANDWLATHPKRAAPNRP